MSHQVNITRIKAVQRALGELAEQVVFVGGATVSLYADRPAEDVRPTDDVDVVIELANYGELAVLEDKLRRRGFANDQESGIICRYKIDGIVVDIMPTTSEALGFSNRWYQQGYHHSIIWNNANQGQIRLFDAAHFVASKVEAYYSRGNGDGRSSTDFEDIVYVINNRSQIWDEFANAPDNIRDFLNVYFSDLLRNRYLAEWIGAHLEHSEQSRVKFIIESMKGFVAQL